MLIDFEVVLKELLDPADLTKVQVFRIHESTEVIIIVSKDKNLVFAAFQVVVPSLKGFNNSQELLIVSLVSSFSEDHLLKKNGYWMPLTNFGLRRN